jgi:hypothetical protein
MTYTIIWNPNMTQALPKPQEVLDKFLQRDRLAVEELQAYSYNNSDAARLNFISARCQDTASMVAYILKYLAEQETKNEH